MALRAVRETKFTSQNFAMYYVYLIESLKDKGFYIECTKDLKERLKFHNFGKVESIKRRKPFKLIYYEAFINQHGAFLREGWLKTGWGRNQIKKILKYYFAVQKGKI